MMLLAYNHSLFLSPTSFFSKTDTHIVLDDDSEGEDDARTCFPCPFCYVDIEVTMLCIHLQEEQCFDLKNAVSECPYLRIY